jgi:hypothetical protein
MRSAGSVPVVVFLQRFLDMLQYRFSIGFRYSGRFATEINRLRTTMPPLRWKRGLEFSFDTIPVSIAHRGPLRNIPVRGQNTAVRLHQ